MLGENSGDTGEDMRQLLIGPKDDSRKNFETTEEKNLIF